MFKILDEVIQYDVTTPDLQTICQESSVLILRKTSFYIEVAVAKEKNEILQKALENHFGLPIKLKYFSHQEIKFIYEDFEIKQQLYNLVKQLVKDEQFASNDIHHFFTLLIKYAIKKKSSDIHIETVENGLIIRFRIDGQLVQIMKFGFGLYSVVSSVIKVISQLDIAKKRYPQNGRFSKNIEEQSFDFRVSIMPISNGESIVIRILNTVNELLSLNNLGINEYSVEVLQKHLINNQGLILVTGPTGSGKTTTMYALINELNLQQKKIITLEDPVEYKMDYVMQIGVDESIGLGYAQVLKNVLRQDPDVIMIGEIRDESTLQIALQASLTGHLVIATLHTNSAIGTIERLLDLKAMPFLIASTLRAIFSQRLVRKVCKHCEAKGCSICNLSGYSDRIIISELLSMNSDIANFIKNDFNKEKLLTFLLSQNYQTMHENGMQKVKENITTIQEIQCVCTSNE